jgi:hypothetical protein
MREYFGGLLSSAYAALRATGREGNSRWVFFDIRLGLAAPMGWNEHAGGLPALRNEEVDEVFA